MAAARGSCCFAAGVLLRRSPLFGLSWSPAFYSTALTVGHGGQRRDTFGRSRTPQFGRRLREPVAPRTEKMELDQDWTCVYPAAAAFKPSAVPLPIRMGYPVKRGVPPAKEGNLELVKVPNFLHLTPDAIRKHCAALKDFCTEWPAVLDNDEKCLQHFPIEIDTVDYVSAGPSVRNPKARGVTLRVKLSSLNLDDHAKKKIIKLVGDRYCKSTDNLTITADRCPLKRQNYDYAVYLLTVLFHESWLVLPESKIKDIDSVLSRSRKRLSPLSEVNKVSALELIPRTTQCSHCMKRWNTSMLPIFIDPLPPKKMEEWEKEKTEADMEEYIWENSVSEKNALDTLHRIKTAEKNQEVSRQELLASDVVLAYKKSMVALRNGGETEENISEYKNSVKRLLNLDGL